MTAIARVDLSAFEHNVSRIVGDVAEAKVWVALKSNAYGHGMLELADNATKAGASGLAVLDIPAALRLRAHGFTGTLFAWLHGHSTDFAAAIEAGIDLGISSFTELDAVAQALGVATIHLKIDTGLHRNGFSVNDWREACLQARQAEIAGEIIVAGVWSHLADASDAADADAISRFSDALAVASECGLTPTVRHIAASSAALRNASSRFDVVRVGIAAYGVSPYGDTDGKGLGLKPVITLSSEVSANEDGASVIAAGWNDGVPQISGGSAWVAVDGVPAQIRAVHPLFTLVDGEYAAGAKVDIVGGTGASAEDWAEWAHTIGDEIVTSIPAHVRRVFVRG